MSSEEHPPQFVGALLHKMSQPLTALRGSLELGLLLSRTPADYRQAMTEAMEQVDRMIRLKTMMNDLLQTEDLSSGLEETPLHHPLRLAAQDLGAARLEIECSETLLVTANPKRLTQAFTSLMSGLLPYCDAESVLTIRGSQNESDAFVEMSASMGSIPSADLANFFDPFYSSRLRREDCGPNLALARRIVEALGGAARTENCSAGFCLEVRMPLAVSLAKGNAASRS